MFYELRILLHRHWPLLGLSLLTSLFLVHSPAFGVTPGATSAASASVYATPTSQLLADDPPTDEPSCDDADGDGECDPVTASPKD